MPATSTSRARSDSWHPLPSSTSLDHHEISCGERPCDSQETRDHEESSSRDLPARSLELGGSLSPRVLSSGVCLRHRSWWHDRLRIHRALEEAVTTGQRSVRFGKCGLTAHVQVSDQDPPQFRISSENCRDRWCRPCQRERSRIIAANIIEKLADRPCRLITLTIRTEGLTLRQGVAKLYTSFQKLRQTTFWKTRVTGGCATCEVKLTQDGIRWHPHLHLLVEGDYVPAGHLGKKWHAITGDSYIVDVRAAADSTTAARYVVKYLGKPVPSSIVRHHDHLVEAIQALTGRRMVATFGNWQGLQLTETCSDVAWHNLCSYRELVEKVLASDADSRRILQHLLGQAGLDPSDLDNWIRETQSLHRPPDTLFAT